MDPADVEVLSSFSDCVEMSYKGEVYAVSVPGKMQARNAALAIEAVSCLAEFPYLIAPNLDAGLRRVNWEFRMQKLVGEPIIIDVTHTAAGARCLAEDISEIYGKVVLVLGMLSDKNIREVASVLAGIATKVFVAPPDSPRAASGDVLYDSMSRVHGDVTLCATVGEALDAALEARGKENVLVTGSFRTAEDALRWIQSGYARS